MVVQTVCPHGMHDLKRPPHYGPSDFGFPEWLLLCLLVLAGFGFVIKKAANTAVILMTIWGLWMLIHHRFSRNAVRSAVSAVSDIRMGLGLLMSQAILTLVLWPLQDDGFNATQFGENLRLLAAVSVFLVLQNHVRTVHAAAFFSAFGLSVPLSIGEWFAGGMTERFATHLLNPNTAGIFAGIALAFFLRFSCLRTIPVILRLACLTAAGGSLFILLTCETRSAWLATALLAAGTGGLALTGLRSRALFATGLVTLLITAGLASDKVSKRMELAVHELQSWRTGELTDSSVGLRLSLMAGAFRLGLEKPLLGHSLSQQYEAVRSRGETGLGQTPESVQLWLNSGVHNHFLDRFVTHGLLGGLLAFLTMTWPCILYVRYRKIALQQNDVASYGLLFFGACTGFSLLVNGMSLNLGYKYLMSLLGLASVLSLVAVQRLSRSAPLRVAE